MKNKSGLVKKIAVLSGLTATLLVCLIVVIVFWVLEKLLKLVGLALSVLLWLVEEIPPALLYPFFRAAEVLGTWYHQSDLDGGVEYAERAVGQGLLQSRIAKSLLKGRKDAK